MATICDLGGLPCRLQSGYRLLHAVNSLGHKKLFARSAEHHELVGHRSLQHGLLHQRCCGS